MATFFSAGRFSLDTSGAERAAEDGPHSVPDQDLLSVLGSDTEAAAIELDVRRARDLPRAVDL